MKVIGGRAKGKRLSVPKGAKIRITSDRTKESLFDILPPLEGKVFLDLFAGSGNVGIEALSRGAASVVFVEKNVRHVGTIRKNLAHCGFTDGFDVMATTAENGMRLLANRGDTFDIIFSDPPYLEGYAQKTLDCLCKYAVSSTEGIIVIEHSFRETFNSDTDKIVVTDQRRYGDTMLSFFWMKKSGGIS